MPICNRCGKSLSESWSSNTGISGGSGWRYVDPAPHAANTMTPRPFVPICDSCAPPMPMIIASLDRAKVADLVSRLKHLHALKGFGGHTPAIRITLADAIALLEPYAGDVGSPAS